MKPNVSMSNITKMILTVTVQDARTGAFCDAGSKWT
jgi:hypothetical protein